MEGGENMDKKMIGLLVAVVIVLVAGFWYVTIYRSNAVVEQKAPEKVVVVVTPEMSPVADATSSGKQELAKEFTVVGSKFKFDPAQIKVKQGDVVKITFKNSDGMHDFVIDELKARTKVIKAGEQEVIQFIADKSGSFEYYCSVGTHRAMGMKGTLIVE